VTPGHEATRQGAPPAPQPHGDAMDKKDKKRLEVLQQKIAKLQGLLAAAKKQPDDPAEAPRLERELAAAHAELAALKKA
jgi:hypothetical protein